MGKKSVKENKNIYQITREDLGYTREKASEGMPGITADRIEKIESEKSLPHPDEIVAMAECYKSPFLCNYYCSHECPIGERTVPEIEMKDLSRIVLEIIGTLNALEERKNRLIEITMDGEITEDEIADFTQIRDKLAHMAATIEALQLWIDKTIADGKLDSDSLKRILTSK